RSAMETCSHSCWRRAAFSMWAVTSSGVVSSYSARRRPSVGLIDEIITRLCHRRVAALSGSAVSGGSVDLDRDPEVVPDQILTGGSGPGVFGAGQSGRHHEDRLLVTTATDLGTPFRFPGWIAEHPDRLID